MEADMFYSFQEAIAVMVMNHEESLTGDSC